jgi:serine/threonine protein phosphatase PrpC
MACQNFDPIYSGSTAVTLVVVKEQLIVANAGDSRCILYKSGGQRQTSSQIDAWEAECLSRDHKPNLAGESERIISKSGRIDALKDGNGNNVGPMRVWMKYEDIPGLAMSRSLGDYAAKALGVIATPDIKIYKRNYETDKAVVLCSDGVCEFLSNEEIGDIVRPYYANNDTEGACRKLIEEATATWLREESVIDDITAIVIFFH